VNFFEQFKKTWTNFSTGQKFSIIGIFAVVVLGLAVLPFVINSTEYGVLYSDLEQQEAGKIVEKLRESRIQYRLSGNSVMVPQDRVHELRLTMAMAGLPSSGVGFELFDKNAFGMTDFVQRLNYQRALQGELTRTISQLDGVEQARVHLALPEQSVFVDQEKKPTASVVLKLRSGAVMGKRQVDGIVHLVASSVEGMQPGGVTVVSSRGEVLFAGNGEEGDSFLTGNQYDLVQTVERYLEGKAQGMLDDFLGPRRAIVKVSVALNFDRIRTERETYDPDGVLRSEQASNSTSGKSGENTSE
jgi:flagellar M-ring protein FliF